MKEWPQGQPSPPGAIPVGFLGVTIEKMSSPLTLKESQEIEESDWWRGLPDKDVALAQLKQYRPCMPFGIFHRAVEVAIGRTVLTVELSVSRKLLVDELEGRPPTRDPMAHLNDVLRPIPVHFRGVPLTDLLSAASSVDEAVALKNSGWWKGLSAKDVILAQLRQQNFFCMSFDDFRDLLEEATGRECSPADLKDIPLLIAEVESRPSSTDVHSVPPASPGSDPRGVTKQDPT